MACTAARRRCGEILRQGTTSRKCGRCCAAYGKTLRQDTAVRHYAKAKKGTTARQCGRRCAAYGKTLRQDTAARHYAKATKGTTARQCGRRCAAYGKTLRKDTAARHYGKAMRQALRKDSPEGTAVFHAARHYGKTLRQALRQEDTTTRHCGKNTQRQETMTSHCGKKLRHVTWHCGMPLRLNRKKERKGGAFTTLCAFWSLLRAIDEPRRSAEYDNQADGYHGAPAVSLAQG